MEIAKKYNLTTPEGKLDGTQTKSVALSNGTTVDVQICGFRHDNKTDGGKAGITFIFKDCIAEHDMNSNNSNAGGWQNSQMRSWLASEGMNMLPEDLKSKIVAVDKMTNNTGKTQSASSVTKTSDSLWLFSLTELAGKGSPNDFSPSYVHAADIYNAEGTEYKLFRDMNVDFRNDNGVLVKCFNGSSGNWWERSPDPTYSVDFQYAGHDGYPFGGTNSADISLGVAPGFCI